MEKIYNVFQHINDENHRLNRNDYLLTLLLYNILANIFVVILVNGSNLITRQGIDTWRWTSVFAFFLCLPLYTSHYHRLRDTGLAVKFAIVIPITGFVLKLINIILPFFTDYSSSGLFGTGTLSLLSGLHLNSESRFYTFTATFMLIQALYMLTNLILILTKTDQFTKWSDK